MTRLSDNLYGGNAKMNKQKLKEYEDFLETVNISEFKEISSDFKVKMEPYIRKKIDAIQLCSDINPIIILYREINVGNYITFFDFYELYTSENKHKLEELRKNNDILLEKWEKGLKFRLYQTWCGFLTQYYFYLKLATLFKDIECSPELDAAGVDIKVTNSKGTIVKLCIAVDTKRGKHFSRKKQKNNITNRSKTIHIYYSLDIKERTSIQGHKYKDCRILSGGFRVPTDEYIQDIAERIEKEIF